LRKLPLAGCEALFASPFFDFFFAFSLACGDFFFEIVRDCGLLRGLFHPNCQTFPAPFFWQTRTPFFLSALFALSLRRCGSPFFDSAKLATVFFLLRSSLFFFSKEPQRGFKRTPPRVFAREGAVFFFLMVVAFRWSVRDLFWLVWPPAWRSPFRSQILLEVVESAI